MNNEIKPPESFRSTMILNTRPYEVMERIELYLVIHRLKTELEKALTRLATYQAEGDEN